jgi:hypothetical protein
MPIGIEWGRKLYALLDVEEIEKVLQKLQQTDPLAHHIVQACSNFCFEYTSLI